MVTPGPSTLHAVIHLLDSLRVRSFIVKPCPHTCRRLLQIACYKVSLCDFVAHYDFVACVCVDGRATKSHAALYHATCYSVMLFKRTLCWVCPLSSPKRSFLIFSPDLDAEFFGDDLASCRNSSISCGICESPQQRLSQENSLRLALRRRCS